MKKIQDGYKAQPLSAFLGQAAPKAAPAIDFVEPLTPEQQKTSPELFNILSFVLQFCATDPSEKELMARFARIGVGAGKTFDASKLSPETKTAIEQGITDAWADMANLQKRLDEKEVTSGDMFGTRQYLKNNYLYRWGCPGRIIPSVTLHGDMMVSQATAGSNRGASRPIRGESRPVHPPVA